MTLLSVRDISAGFAAKDVVHKVSFDLAEGEFVGLIGPNGAGKSTLLRAVLRLIPYRGSVLFGADDAARLPAREISRRAAYVPQERDIAWAVPVDMLVGLGRVPHRPAFSAETASDLAVVEHAMTVMDVLHLRHRHATELSGGERARVLIARALAQDTPLLLTDEPTAGLDPAHQIALMETFAGLAGKGRGVLACLHDLWLAARWCSRIIVIDEGQVIADGTPAEVLTSDRLAAVYGIKAHVGEVDGGLLILPTALSGMRRDPGGSVQVNQKVSGTS